MMRSSSSTARYCWLAERNHFKPEAGYGHQLFVQCFPAPAMEDFAQALLPPFAVKNLQFETSHFDKQQIEECRRLAREALLGSKPQAILKELQYNYRYYQNHSVVEFPDREIWTLRMEHELDDMKLLDVALGGNGNMTNINTPPPQVTHRLVRTMLVFY